MVFYLENATILVACYIDIIKKKKKNKNKGNPRKILLNYITVQLSKKKCPKNSLHHLCQQASIYSLQRVTKSHLKDRFVLVLKCMIQTHEIEVVVLNMLLLLNQT